MENQNNNKGVIALLVVIIVILAVLCVLFATRTITLKSNSVDNENQQTSETNDIIEDNNEGETELNTNYCNNIVGNYSFEEVIPNGGDANGITSVTYDYKLSIVNEQNNCNATLEINGFQTFNRIQLNVQYNSGQYDFLFDTYADGDVTYSGNAGTYNKGDILFSFYKNNELYTHWGKYLPHVEKNKTDGIYFKKQ